MLQDRKVIIATLILLGLLAGGAVLAYRPLEVSYPQLPSVVTPLTVRTPLPEYIKYIFNFSLLIIGLVILSSLVRAGFRYATSVGNPDQMRDSRDQAISALTGGIILLGAYLLLSTINPELVILRLPGVTPASAEVKIFNGYNRTGDSMTLARGEPKLDSFGQICLPPPAEGCGARSLDYSGINPQDIDISIYSSINYGGTEAKISASNSSSFPFVAKSIKIGWKPPGVYLFAGLNFDSTGKWKSYQYSSPILFDFNDVAKSIMFKNREGEPPYGAILHRDQNYQGLCGVFLSNNWGEIAGDLENLDSASLAGVRKHGEIRNNEASSITVFRINENTPPGGEVKLTGKGIAVPGLQPPIQTITRSGFSKETWDLNPITTINGTLRNTVNSVEINGNFLVVLFEHVNWGAKCEVFTKSDDDLSNNPIGRCTNLPLGFTCPSIPVLNWQAPCLTSCVSSFMVIPTAP